MRASMLRAAARRLCLGTSLAATTVLAGCASISGGGVDASGGGAGGVTIAGLHPHQQPREPVVLTEPGFSNSDPLGYVLFVIGPQARANMREGGEAVPTNGPPKLRRQPPIIVTGEPVPAEQGVAVK